VVAWFCGKRWAFAATIFAAMTWWSANYLGGDPELHGLMQAWEIFRHGGFFVVVAFLGSALRAKSDIAAARIALLERARHLEHEIVNISEAEQRRLGRDLHDGLCQYLAGLSCAAAGLRDDLRALHLEDKAESADELVKLLQDSVVQTRDLAHALVPAQVVELGLAVALESLAQSITRLHAISCTFEAREAPSHCDNETATHLYRIAQEAISNAIKHGAAKNIHVSLATAGDRLILRVTDDGLGLRERGSTKGSGLAIMEYRARISGGDLKIGPAERSGTEVRCTVRRKVPDDEVAVA
jgi:signal transduction histidine kinase